MNESLAVTTVLSVFIISILIPLNHGGLVYYGLAYVPSIDPIVAIVFYAFTIISIYYIIKGSVRLRRTILIARLTYTLGLIYQTSSASIMLFHNLDATSFSLLLLSSIIDSVLVFAGLLLEYLYTGTLPPILKFVASRDVRDTFLLAMAFLILSLTRVIKSTVPLEASLFFLASSWILVAHILWKYVREAGMKPFDLRELVIVLSINVIYLLLIPSLIIK